MKKVTWGQLGNSFLISIRYLLLYLSFLFIVAFISSLIVNELIKFFVDIILGLVFILLIIFIARKTDDFRNLGIKRLRLKEVIVPLMLATLLYGISIILIFLLNQNSLLIEYFPDKLNDVLILSVYVIFHGGVKEELFFRGVLFELIKVNSQNIVIALVFTSIAFGLIHTFDNFISITFLYYVFMGFLLGLLKLWSKNIFVPILFHAGWNIWIAFTNKVNNIGPLISISTLTSSQQSQIDAITSGVFFLGAVIFIAFNKYNYKLILRGVRD